MDEIKFKALDVDGKEVECEVILTFHSEATDKWYVVYTDGELDEDGDETIYANVVEIIGDEGEARLLPIETDEEYDMIDDMLEKAQTKEGLEESNSNI